jgi:hypothetical protein
MFLGYWLCQKVMPVGLLENIVTVTGANTQFVFNWSNAFLTSSLPGESNNDLFRLIEASSFFPIASNAFRR